MELSHSLTIRCGFQPYARNARNASNERTKNTYASQLREIERSNLTQDILRDKYQPVAVRYRSITESAPLLDEDGNVIGHFLRALRSLRKTLRCSRCVRTAGNRALLPCTLRPVRQFPSPTFVFQQVLPGFAAGHEADLDAVAFRRVGVFLARVAAAAAHSGAATVQHFFDDGEHVAVNAETLHVNVIRRYHLASLVTRALLVSMLVYVNRFSTRIDKEALKTRD